MPSLSRRQRGLSVAKLIDQFREPPATITVIPMALRVKRMFKWAVENELLVCGSTSRAAKR
jgi:hypothetical protein